jgi:hypothetical protein
MFYVSYGKPENISDKLMDAIVLFASEFLDIDENIEIDFEEDLEEDKCGFCDYDKDEGVTIAINRELKKSEIIKTIFHEMVHAKQFINNELISGEGRRPSRWFGKEYDVPYFESPWEQEAYEFEAVMWDIFRKEFNWLGS